MQSISKGESASKRYFSGKSIRLTIGHLVSNIFLVLIISASWNKSITYLDINSILNKELLNDDKLFCS